MKVDLFLTPQPFGKSVTEDKTIVIIDVLRSSTSICQALTVGAKAVIPTNGRGEAGDMWRKIGVETTLLAGEQNGEKIENFQLGNSPFEFVEEVVRDKFIIMSTSNGTPVFNHTKNAALVVSCGLVNISKIADTIAAKDKNIIIVCSGKEGQFSIEDTICGGLLIDKLLEKNISDLSINDAGRLAHLLYKTNNHQLEKTILEGEHGQFLNSIGFDRDVSYASRIDSLPVVPILKDGQLVIEK